MHAHTHKTETVTCANWGSVCSDTPWTNNLHGRLGSGHELLHLNKKLTDIFQRAWIRWWSGHCHWQCGFGGHSGGSGTGSGSGNVAWYSARGSISCSRGGRGNRHACGRNRRRKQVRFRYRIAKVKIYAKGHFQGREGREKVRVRVREIAWTKNWTNSNNISVDEISKETVKTLTLAQRLDLVKCK